MVKKDNDVDVGKIVDSLSPNERRLIGNLDCDDLDELAEKVEMDKTSVLRALSFLANKNVVEVSSDESKVIELGVNGVLYVRKGLPERRLANLVSERKSVGMGDAVKELKMSDNEFKASLGALKKKALINLVNGRIMMVGDHAEFASKSLEEKFLETLPRALDSLRDEERFAFENLRSRKDIVEVVEKKVVGFKVLELGKKLMGMKIGDRELLEGLSGELLRSGKWKGKKFRRYDVTSDVPRIDGGKKHFMNQSIDYGKRIWLDMGFKEMEGSLLQSGFWNFDALFTAQDHPVREMQDTFFVKGKVAKMPAGEVVSRVKKVHEGGISGSRGWGGKFDEENSKKVVMRTHTTCLSAQTLLDIGKRGEFPAKYFALGKCFRNETVDWSHGFEFNQTEGIVVDENANFRQLLGYLVEFFRKMGYDKIKIRPGYFPYTEPSLEIDVFHPVHKKWVELGGAGMFRPEVTIPMFGRHIPVLAWGPGFDRIIMEYFKIHDLRDMYKNDLNKLRDMRVWDR